MNEYTPIQRLKKVHRDLWTLIHLLGVVERQVISKGKVYADVVDVENVLRAAVGEVGGIIARNAGFLEKPQNIRQAEDFALKASVAKARGAAPAHRQECPSGPSHKGSNVN